MFGTDTEKWNDIKCLVTSCLARHDKVAWSWGYNYYGQLGDNTVISRCSPVSVSFPMEEIGIYSGPNANHSFIITKKDGLLYGWGYDNISQIGYGPTLTSAHKSVPAVIFGSGSFTAIASGSYHSVAIKSGKLWAWGRNDYGQLGENSTTNAGAPISASSADSFVVVAGGNYFTCALRNDGRVFAWGDNTYGQLGDNSTTSKSGPVSVSSVDSFVAIACGQSYVVAIKGSNGLLYAWGYNGYGQLGDNSATNRSVPVSVSSADSFIAVACGGNHTVAIKGSNGLLYAWGLNSSGQLGDNSTTSRLVPVSVSSADSFVAVACGQSHTIAIKHSNGLLYAWGYNSSGQLGDNSTTGRSVPVSVSSADSFVKIAGGVAHTVAIKGSNGLLYAWGYNTPGQLGDNSTTNRSVPVSVSSADSFVAVACGSYHTTAIKGSNGYVYSWGDNTSGNTGANTHTQKRIPVPVISTDSWKMVDAGLAFSAAIRGDGRLFAWGEGSLGKLGNNSITNATSPVSVSSADSFVAVACGQAHTIAIKGSDGRLYSWGYNNNGQLGDNSLTNRSYPVSVSTADSFIAIACGNYHSLAIRGSDGLLYAWGYNGYGQLGDNSTTNRSVPASVSSADSFIAVACGPNHSFALRYDKIIFSWGRNESGQLSKGNEINISVPSSVEFSFSNPTLVLAASTTSSRIDYGGGVWTWGSNTMGSLGINTFTSQSQLMPTSAYILTSPALLVVGNTHAAVIRASDGRLFMWGQNYYGQLGDNSTTDRVVSVSVSSVDSFIAVACGTYHTVAIKGSNGLLYAWGNNTYGQLGDNSVTSRSVPVSVSSADSFVAVACGYEFTIAIRGDGRLFAWGLNTNGALGDNSTTNRSVPVSVSNASSFVAAACGYDSVVAIRGDGRLFAWGTNSQGQVGDNTITNKSVPVSVSTADSFTKVDMGDSFVLALRGDGRLFAWGDNTSGQIGDNTVSRRSYPVSVSTADSFKAIAAAGLFAVAIKGSDGRAWAWGYNYYGQLGDGTTASRSVPGIVSTSESFAKVVAYAYGGTIATLGATGLIFSWGMNGYGMLADGSTRRPLPTLMCKLPG